MLVVDQSVSSLEGFGTQPNTRGNSHGTEGQRDRGMLPSGTPGTPGQPGSVSKRGEGTVSNRGGLRRVCVTSLTSYLDARATAQSPTSAGNRGIPIESESGPAVGIGSGDD